MGKLQYKHKLVVKSKKNQRKRKQAQSTQQISKLSKQIGLGVILKHTNNNPCCPHGPTLLFSKRIKSDIRNFYACAAQRDRKFCSFYLPEGENMKNPEIWKENSLNFLKGINHRKKFLLLNEVKLLKSSKRVFCYTCSLFVLPKQVSKHEEHNLLKGVTDDQLANPTEILPPSENDKSEAQYWFSETTVKTIVNIFESLKYKNLICIGTPRIHEYIKNNCENISSILLDFDKRFHNFYGPLEFCWYNMFNNHFYLKVAKEVFHDFLQLDNGDNMAIITDPPFGGRTEPIAFTFEQLNKMYQKLNNRNDEIPLFWIYPYFMEPHIYYSNPKFSMIDYKVEYENHAAFGKGPKARKLGSPVRIFTTVSPSLIKLPEESGYKYCEKCNKWVSNENNHCDLCKACTSRDGRTYIHCFKCKKCVKPTYVHCDQCGRCKLKSHACAKGKDSNMPHGKDETRRAPLSVHVKIKSTRK